MGRLTLGHAVSRLSKQLDQASKAMATVMGSASSPRLHKSHDSDRAAAGSQHPSSVVDLFGKYRPDQSRGSEGTPEGGQFVDEGGGGGDGSTDTSSPSDKRPEREPDDGGGVSDGMRRLSAEVDEAVSRNDRPRIRRLQETLFYADEGSKADFDTRDKLIDRLNSAVDQDGPKVQTARQAVARGTMGRQSGGNSPAGRDQMYRDTRGTPAGRAARRKK